MSLLLLFQGVPTVGTVIYTPHTGATSDRSVTDVDGSGGRVHARAGDSATGASSGRSRTSTTGSKGVTGV